MENLADLLAPCGMCASITDKEAGFIASRSVMLFKTLNGSSRYVFQVHGRNVASALIQSDNPRSGRVMAVFINPEYSGGGLFRPVYLAMKKDFDSIRFDPQLGDCPDAFEFINAVRK